MLPPQLARAIGGVKTLVDGLGSGHANRILRTIVQAGYRDETHLTNLVFWARHPESAGQAIAPEERGLAQEWLRARDLLVRPVLSAPRSVPTDPGPDRRSPSGGGITSKRLGAFGGEGADAFRRKVYDKQLARNKRKDKEFFPGLPVAELADVEGHRLHIAAAADCRSMLARARADLAQEQSEGRGRASRVRLIGISSAYRDPERDFRAWKNAFSTHYKRTSADRAALPGGQHGSRAVSLLVARMVTVKALPGFSNHTRGLAVDLRTRESGTTYGPRSAQKEGWQRTWLYAWLVDNAAAFGFKPYRKEPWHWDHG